MREILFRGKRKDNGEWATATSIFKAECAGELRFYINSLSDATVYFNSDGNITRTETELDCEWLEVIQETVGQFTGLTDKNGTKIFEGDIVQYSTFDDFDCQSVVKFGEYNQDGSAGEYNSKNIIGWYVDVDNFTCPDWAEDDPTLFSSYLYQQNLNEVSDSCEVIGNIHDNPELLEEGDS